MFKQCFILIVSGRRAVLDRDCVGEGRAMFESSVFILIVRESRAVFDPDCRGN